MCTIAKLAHEAKEVVGCDVIGSRARIAPCGEKLLMAVFRRLYASVHCVSELNAKS